MNDIWNCHKKPEECTYRFDYRGCIKENCPFPHEYKQKETCLFNNKWGRYTDLSGYDFTFVVNNRCFYAKEIYRGYGMACNTVGYEVYKINEVDYKNHMPFSKLTLKEYVMGTGTNVGEDNYYLQFSSIS